MRRLIRLILLVSSLLLLVSTILLFGARQKSSTTHWLILCQDDSEWGHYSGTNHLVRVSPGGGRLFQVTPPRGDGATHFDGYSDEWVYLWQTQYADQFGNRTAAMFRISRADLHEEVLGWFSVGDLLIPRHNGDWLELDTLNRLTALYRMERPDRPRELLFQFDQPNLKITTNTLPIFSDDGEWMYFNVVDMRTRIGDVYRVRLDGSDLTNLTSHVDTSLALQTAFFDEGWMIVQDATPTHVLYRMHLDGTDFTPLTDDPNRLEWVTWLPQAHLAILRDHNTNALLSVGLDDPTPVWRVTESVQAARSLSSGTLAIRTAHEVALIRPDGTRQHLADMLPSLKFAFITQQASWLYYYDESFTNRIVIGRMDTNTGRREQLVAGLYMEVAEVAPDGTWLVVTGVVDGQPGLYRLNMDGSGLVRLADDHRRYTFMGFGPPIDRDWSVFILAGLAISLVLLPRFLRTS